MIFSAEFKTVYIKFYEQLHIKKTIQTMSVLSFIIFKIN